MQWDYLAIRFNYKGLGIKQEFALLDVDGERVLSRTGQEEEAPGTLKDLLKLVGEDGWELVTHTIAESSGMQYMNFKRPRVAEVAEVNEVAEKAENSNDSLL